jgi:hypothetical protein
VDVARTLGFRRLNNQARYPRLPLAKRLVIEVSGIVLPARSASV